METIRGKMSHHLDSNGFAARLADYNRVILDLGTGDGRYVRYLADRHPDTFIIGVDSCRENLREHSRANLSNALFLIASAQDLPHELHGRISHITINFPWGSLLKSLLFGDDPLMQGLQDIARGAAWLDVRLNSGALAEIGVDLEAGASTIHHNLLYTGWQMESPIQIGAPSLRGFPTTWARRLAHGRDPRAMTMKGRHIK